MAGGIFPPYKFEPNWKCVVFTLAVAGGYWFLPHRRYWVLFVLLIVPYVAMAWYDYAYKCTPQLRPTLFPYGRTIFLPLKPPEYQQAFSTMPPEAIDAMDRLDHNVTWILLVCLGVFIAYRLAGRRTSCNAGLRSA